MTQQAYPFPLTQNCWVVPDIEAAARPWLEIGIGPFLVFDFHAANALYRGAPVPLSMTVALAQAGPMQIELIRQTSPGPSAFRDVVPEGGFGFHHVCRSFGDYDASLEKLKAAGGIVATEFAFNGARTCYVDTRATHGCMIELVDSSDTSEWLVTTVRVAAETWDGSDPIRPLSIV